MQKINWNKKYPSLLKNIEEEIQKNYKTLLLQKSNDNYLIIGTLIIKDPLEVELERYNIEIKFPEKFPDEIPIVFETSNKIPCSLDRHKYNTNECCLCLPDEIFFIIERNYTITDFIEKIVKPYFLWQKSFDLNNGISIFKYRDHGELGIIEFYKEKLRTDNIDNIIRFLKDAHKFEIKRYLNCYCGSNKKIKNCCDKNIIDLKNRIPLEIIKKSYNDLCKFK